jgi:predicted nucleic acid-binding protein
MANLKLLIDTDIIIDCLKGIKAARTLCQSKNIELYCSILSKKELLSKPGLTSSERKKIIQLLSKIKILRIDADITRKYSLLIEKYGENPNWIIDCLIAATAWSKQLPLLTRNRKHFLHIQEIKLTPGYEIDAFSEAKSK